MYVCYCYVFLKYISSPGHRYQYNTKNYCYIDNVEKHTKTICGVGGDGGNDGNVFASHYNKRCFFRKTQIIHKYKIRENNFVISIACNKNKNIMS